MDIKEKDIIHMQQFKNYSKESEESTNKHHLKYKITFYDCILL